MTKKDEYELTMDLVSERPDHLQKALDELRRLADVRGAETGEIKVKVKLSSEELGPLQQVRELMEVFVRSHQVLVAGTVTMKQPLVKPDGRRTVAVITPMDSLWAGRKDEDSEDGSDD